MIPKHPQNDDHTLKHMPIQCNHRNLYIYLLYMYDASANAMQCNLVTKSIYWARPLIEFKKLMESESYLRIFLVEKHGAFSFLCHWQTGSICSKDSKELFLPLSFSSHLCSILYLFISHSRNVGENIILRWLYYFAIFKFAFQHISIKFICNLDISTTFEHDSESSASQPLIVTESTKVAQNNFMLKEPMDKTRKTFHNDFTMEKF